MLSSEEYVVETTISDILWSYHDPKSLRMTEVLAEVEEYLPAARIFTQADIQR